MVKAIYYRILSVKHCDILNSMQRNISPQYTHAHQVHASTGTFLSYKDLLIFLLCAGKQNYIPVLTQSVSTGK
jgi:hypothetical protein